MEPARNVLLIDRGADRVGQLRNLLINCGKKISVFTSQGQYKVPEILSENEIRCVFINGNIGKTDVVAILRLIMTINKKKKFEVPIYFTSEDFGLLQSITDEFRFEHFKILHTPLDIDDLAEKIKLTLIGKPASAAGKIPPQNLKVDVEFMNIFISSTQRVISEMAQITDLAHRPPTLMAKLQTPMNIAVSSKILISSTYFSGSYFIAFPKETFLNFYGIVVMEECKEITNENRDFVSELANIIYGQCKKALADKGYNLGMIIPSVHMGEIKHSVVIIIPFECLLGTFYLAIAPGLV